MLTRALILSLLALTGADAACSCYFANGNQINGPKISVSNGYDSSDFSTCYVDGGCGFIAYSGSDAVGWSNITITFSSQVDTTGQFAIYDGKTVDPNTKRATFAVADSGKIKSFTSSTPYIYVLYTQADKTNPNAYYGNLIAGSSFALPPTSPAPATTPPSSNYNKTLYPFDPYLISHDTLIMVNQKTTQGIAGLNALNSIAGQFVDLLSVTTSLTGESQTRLGLVTVTPYQPNFAAQGEIWAMSADDVKNSLPKAGFTTNVDIINALNKAVPAFFNISDPSAPTRKNVQRSVVLLTAWWDDTQSLNDVRATFDAYGVNLAVILYNTDSTTLAPPTWYNLASLITTTAQDVASITNRFFFNSAFGGNMLTNNWCRADSYTVSSNFSEPNNYGGPPVIGAAWGSTDGQRQRYCNFQDSTYTYNRIDPTKIVAFTVYYELEVDQDFLKFYADGVEVESFTGMDVQNAYFQLNATVVTARFTTDNAGVRRGFYVKVEEK